MPDRVDSPLIHIGYPKAASTWLQFNFQRDGAGLHFPFFRSTKIYEEIVEPRPFEWQPETARQNLEAELQSGWKGEGIPVVSEERLAGHWLTGGYDSKRIADRLSELFPEGKVLISIREQEAMVNSVYRQYVKKGGWRSVENLIDPDGTGAHRGPDFSLDFWRYDRIVDYYQNLFGRSDVLVLPIEILPSRSTEAFQEILDFAGAQAADDFEPVRNRKNVGISAHNARMRRWANPFIRSDYANDYSPLKGGALEKAVNKLYNIAVKYAPASLRERREEELEEAIRREVEDFYRESNQRLDKRIDQDLEGLGYRT